MTYTAPLKDIRFALEHGAEISGLATLPAFADALSPDMVEAVLGEAAKLAENIWAPTNTAGDKQPPRLEAQGVVTPLGFKDAYHQFAHGGWNSLAFASEHGGQGMPWAMAMATNEMWQSANLALSLCPLLSQAAIEAIEKYGTADNKHTYLPKMISGEWPGTMQLTEPQAGTDLAAIRTLAKENGDHYLLKGQKIFITWGDHDFSANIIHLVLARIDGLPEGNDGLGLFIIPKYLVKPDGSLGARNDIAAVSLEHKLGIHGSPTCVMSLGEKDGAIGYLIGKPGEGLKNMFTMMNNARIGVGLQGVALSERAYQHALTYAKDRVQSQKLGDRSGQRVAIIQHPDVRRMLMTIKATTEAARALCYYAGGQIDRSRHAPDQAARDSAAARVDLLTPLVKAWATDLAVDNASSALQVHGGMGFIEETGAAQHYRDARILPIYEGTNGIQSNDLVFRKLLRDGGAEVARFLSDIKAAGETLSTTVGDDAAVIAKSLTHAVASAEKTTAWMLANAKSALQSVAASAQPYQRQMSLLAGGFMMARQANAALTALHSGNDADFYAAKLMTARYFCEAVLPQVQGLTDSIMGGHAIAVQIADDQL